MPAEKIVVAMSGGVDSSVAAAILKERGHRVTGLFMRNGIAWSVDEARRKSCCSADDAADARRVAAALDIPFYALDFEDGFARIIDHFVAEYQRGRTPNPCIQCNRYLKFGRLLSFARSLGASAVATGHYARTEVGADGRRRLLRGLDVAKDQSYQLFSLSRVQLEAARFPVGEMSKEDVRSEARALKLPVADKPDSQEICFVPGNDYRALVRSRAPGSEKPGELVDRAGRTLGRHPGTAFFTIGQRHGLGLALGRPAFVVEIRPERNEVVIGERDDLLSSEMICGQVSWLIDPPPWPLRAKVKIRSRHAGAMAEIRRLGGAVFQTVDMPSQGESTSGAFASGIGPRAEPISSADRFSVHFDEPQSSVTPGQAAVLYDGDRVLGGGWIETPCSAHEGG